MLSFTEDYVRRCGSNVFDNASCGYDGDDDGGALLVVRGNWREKGDSRQQLTLGNVA